MKSTNYINFSVRQNKSIERSLVVEAMRRLAITLDRRDFVYVGFGSVWFIDFDAAHRDIGIETMISIEADEVLYKRACFNKPYRTVEVINGLSHDALPQLLSDRADLIDRPWITWLDYDEVLDETKVDELSDLVETLPDNSMLITTFSASPARYGRPAELRERLTELFGDAFPIERFTAQRQFKDEKKMMVALSETVVSLLQATFVRIARPGRFVPIVQLQYQDGTPMATAGGLLASTDTADAVSAEVAQDSWAAISTDPIVTPPLTYKEVAALKSLLPSKEKLTRDSVREIGFDLSEDQLLSFSNHYLKYPSYFQSAH